ncbi:Asp23/Gls24 family envelope stress response protein [Streptomyces sp. NPDC012421]|uniref:Asp23/Gls24 family envelope stress response protein n=1 Tax=Streptomyces sp. NPDC012421 TaxID=3364832 RepID=UPI0036E385F2
MAMNPPHPREAPDDRTPDDQTPDDQASGEQAPDDQTPDDQASGEQAPDDQTPDAHAPEILACGRDLATVWERAARPHTDDPHLLTCVSCQQAVSDLERLRAAALPPAGAPPAPVDTSDLVRRVMDVVRLELRPGRHLPLGEMDEDSWIYESVAARTLRTAAETVADVRAGSCRITPPGGRAPARGPVTVHIEITVAYGRDLRATCDAVRDSLSHAAREHLGLHVTALDVTVTDLHDPPDHPDHPDHPDRPQGAST